MSTLFNTNHIGYSIVLGLNLSLRSGWGQLVLIIVPTWWLGADLSAEISGDSIDIIVIKVN